MAALPATFRAAVLAGGRSTRMGRDKALVDLGGRTLIEHALALLRAMGAEPVIAGNRPDLSAFAPVLNDLHPGCGPLSGIEAALTWADEQGADRVLFLPVDLPLLPPVVLRLLVERATMTDARATVPTLLGRAQPLCSVLHTALLPAITAALDAADYKVMRPLERLDAGVLDLFPIEAVAATRVDWPRQSPVHRWFDNLNTPHDRARITASPAPGSSTTLIDR